MRITFCLPIDFRVYALAAGLSLIGLATHAQSCRLEVPIRVELKGETFTLADLLPADTCPSLVHVAAQVRLGKVPREGVARVFDGADLRDRLQSVAGSHSDKLAVDASTISQRVTVTRSGIPSSCPEVVSPFMTKTQNSTALQAIDCGLLSGIPSDARFELAKKTWDPALRSWEFVARCTEPQACVPFLIRVPNQSEGGFPSSMGTTSKNAEPLSAIYPGKKTEVIWSQNGIRILLLGIALDSGRAGDKIRVHLKSGPIITAIVNNSGALSWQK